MCEVSLHYFSANNLNLFSVGGCREALWVEANVCIWEHAKDWKYFCEKGANDNWFVSLKTASPCLGLFFTDSLGFTDVFLAPFWNLLHKSIAGMCLLPTEIVCEKQSFQEDVWSA